MKINYEIDKTNGAIANVVYTTPPPYNYVSALTYMPQTAFDFPNCIDTLNVNIKEMSVQASEDTIICVGESVQLNVAGGAQYSWSPSSSLDDPSIAAPLASPLSTTIYYISSDSGNCNASDSVTVFEN